MISRIPALELLREFQGAYADQSGEAELRIWQCGYGAAINLVSKGKTILCGVAGACGQDIECFVQVGLPNVTRTIGKKFSDAELRLVGVEPPIEFRFVRKGRGVDVAILFKAELKGTYELHAV